MERIYFDKQIFSYLFKADKSVYQSFSKLLLANKHNFLYCYSHAHLRDLLNDKTNIKYDELGFIETLVNDNYLSYHATEKRTSCYLVKPIIAFRDIENEPEFSFTNLFDDLDLSYATIEQQEQFAQAKTDLIEKKFDFNFIGEHTLPEDLAPVLKTLLTTDLPEMNLIDWTNHFLNMVKEMEENRSVYKGLRSVTDKYINNGRFTIEYENIDFNDDLKNSVLKKTFIDYVNSNLNPDGKKEVTKYDFFTNAYFTLDLLGISKEPQSKVRFRNVLNDSFHSYYGAYCDYVVSDDEGFLKKTIAMYRLLGIKSKVYHIDEFIPLFSFLTNNSESNLEVFLDLLINDLDNGLVQSVHPSLQRDRVTTSINPNAIYLGYFNKLERISEGGKDYIFLSRQTNNYSSFEFYRAYEGVVNKAIKLFGMDDYFKGNYDWDRECKEVNKGAWEGRWWTINRLQIYLHINKGTGNLSMQITVQ